MAQINKSSDYFNTVLYTGDATSSRNITGVGFDTDFVWIKNRSIDASHFLGDRLRGDNKNLNSNASAAEEDNNTKFRSLVTDGFQVGSHAGANGNGNNIVAWNWLANGTGSSNTDGSITSTVSANTTSGFSIVSYTGTGANATVGHGLGSAPKMIIFKSRSNGTKNWITYHDGIGNTKAIFLNLTQAPGTGSDYWNNTSPDSSVFTLGNNANHNESSGSMIAYCFAEKKGFSKAFSYTGNGSTDGSFCYLGMKAKFIMIKRTDSTGDWVIYDGVKEPYNVIDTYLEANSSNADTTLAVRELDILSNGFKVRGTNTSINASGSNYIGIAFAESPLVGTNNTPATAR